MAKSALGTIISDLARRAFLHPEGVVPVAGVATTAAPQVSERLATYGIRPLPARSIWSGCRAVGGVHVGILRPLQIHISHPWDSTASRVGNGIQLLHLKSFGVGVCTGLWAFATMRRGA